MLEFATFKDACFAIDNLGDPTACIRHVIILPNGKYSIVGHMLFEECQYCHDEKNFIFPGTKYKCTGPHRFQYRDDLISLR